MGRRELTAAIQTTMGESVIVVNEFTDVGGYGTVRWARPAARSSGATTEYIVHRWATKDTAGNDIPFRLYSGFYTLDKEAAMADFKTRSQRSW